MFVYDLTEYTQDILLTDRLLFALCVDDEKVRVYGVFILNKVFRKSL